MDELIVASLQGSASQADEEALKRWRSEAPANEERYRAVARVWQATAPRDVAQAAPRPSGFQIMRAAGERAATTQPDVRFRRRYSLWMKVAGSGLVAASFVGGLFSARLLPEPPTFEASHVETEPGGKMTLSLSDGSVIRAAPGSSIRFEDSLTERIVWLDGRAFFAVARADHLPFVVRTGMGEVVVHGTRFQVLSSEEGLEVLVVDGAVAVKSATEQRALVGGQLAHVQSGGAVSVTDVEKVQERLTWMGDFLVFNNTPLRNALPEVEARFGIPIRVQDSANLDRSITATFQNEAFRAVMDVICHATAARCTVTDTLAVIRGSR